MAEVEFTTDTKYLELWTYYMSLYNKKLEEIEIEVSRPETPVYLPDLSLQNDEEDLADNLGDEGMQNLDNIQEE